MSKINALLLLFLHCAALLIPSAYGGNTNSNTNPYDGDTQEAQPATKQFAGIYHGRYAGRWMGFYDAGDVQFMIDTTGNIDVKSQGHIGFGTAIDMPIDPPEGVFDTLIIGWGSVDDSGDITVGLRAGEMATISITAGIIDGSWSSPDGDYCIVNASKSKLKDPE